MLDPIFILILYFCFINGKRALRKGYNRWAWSIYSLISFFITELLGATIVIYYFCRGIIDLHRFGTDPTYSDTAIKILSQEFVNNPIRWVTIDLFGIGGFLFARYIIDKLPTKPNITDNSVGNNNNT